MEYLYSQREEGEGSSNPIGNHILKRMFSELAAGSRGVVPNQEGPTLCPHPSGFRWWWYPKMGPFWWPQGMCRKIWEKAPMSNFLALMQLYQYSMHCFLQGRGSHSPPKVQNICYLRAALQQHWQGKVNRISPNDTFFTTHSNDKSLINSGYYSQFLVICEKKSWRWETGCEWNKHTQCFSYKHTQCFIFNFNIRICKIQKVQGILKVKVFSTGCPNNGDQL